MPFEQTVCFLFLKDHGVQYGIVCDYQLFLESSADRSPNHFRYVGEEAAAFIYENNLSLSEYRALLEPAACAGRGGAQRHGRFGFVKKA